MLCSAVASRGGCEHASAVSQNDWMEYALKEVHSVDSTYIHGSQFDGF